MFILKKGHQPGVYVPLRALFLVFCAKQCLVSPFIIPANRDPGVQIGHAPGALLSAIVL